MSVSYKFKSSFEKNTLPIDGIHIKLSDLKQAIIDQKKMGKHKNLHYDLQVTNANTMQSKST